MSSHVRDLHKRPGPSEFNPPPRGPADNSERYAEERRRIFEVETTSGDR